MFLSTLIYATLTEMHTFLPLTTPNRMRFLLFSLMHAFDAHFLLAHMLYTLLLAGDLYHKIQ